jgi:hypothetical protein
MIGWLITAALVAGSGQAPEPVPAAGQRRTDGMSEAAERSRVVAEARQLMQGYADDLRAGDRAALAARYARQGAWRLTPDSRFVRRQQWEEIRDAFAAPDWSRPAHFDWFTLNFHFIDSNNVAVVASVDRSGGSPAFTHLYSALLVREEGVLRIRLEHEAPAPAQ